MSTAQIEAPVQNATATVSASRGRRTHAVIPDPQVPASAQFEFPVRTLCGRTIQVRAVHRVPSAITCPGCSRKVAPADPRAALIEHMAKRIRWAMHTGDYANATVVAEEFAAKFERVIANGSAER